MAKQPAGLRKYWATHRKGGMSRRRTRTMKNGRPTHRKKQMNVSLAVIAGLLPIPIKAYDAWKQGQGASQIARQTLMAFTGWDFWNNNWKPGNLMYGLAPAVAGILAHKLANRLGVNRSLKAAGIPWISI